MNETTRYKRDLDHARKVARISGPLILLGYEGEHEYVPVMTIVEGWCAWYKPRREYEDGEPPDVKVIIADVHEGLPAALKGATRAPRFSIEGVVYSFEDDRTRPPMGQPRSWVLEGFRTDDVFAGVGG